MQCEFGATDGGNVQHNFAGAFTPIPRRRRLLTLRACDPLRLVQNESATYSYRTAKAS